jgi:FMN reductase
MVRVLGLGGSLRQVSRSKVILEAALAAATAAGAETALWAVDEEPLPFYRPQEPIEPSTERFLKAVREADAYIVSTPAYHGTVSAPVKNLIDHIDALAGDTPPFLTGKVVGVASIGEGTVASVQAVGALVQAAHALRAFVVPLHVPVSGASQVIPTDRIQDPSVVSRLVSLGRLVVATSEALGSPGQPRPPDATATSRNA